MFVTTIRKKWQYTNIEWWSKHDKLLRCGKYKERYTGNPCTAFATFL